MNNMFLPKSEHISSRKTSSESNYSAISSNRYFASMKTIKKKAKKKVTFKDVKVIEVECWKKYNENTSNEKYENIFDKNHHKKNEEISCICMIY